MEDKTWRLYKVTITFKRNHSCKVHNNKKHISVKIYEHKIDNRKSLPIIGKDNLEAFLGSIAMCLMKKTEAS